MVIQFDSAHARWSRHKLPISRNIGEVAREVLVLLRRRDHMKAMLRWPVEKLLAQDIYFHEFA